MPKSTIAGHSNGLEAKEPSAGSSSSTSESKPDKSGSSRQATGQSPQSPAQDAPNRSKADRQEATAERSTVPTTDGSTQETGSGQHRQSSSSAEVTPQPAPPATKRDSKK